jgi:hypothetical protein
MANSNQPSGFSLLLHRKRAVVWLYVCNLVLALLAADYVLHGVGAVTEHSAYSDSLSRGLDAIALVEMYMRSEMNGPALGIVTFFPAFIYTVLVLFVSAGIVRSFLSVERPTLGEFFQACGAFFWRFVRLALLTLLVAVPVLGILNAIRHGLLRLTDRQQNGRIDFGVSLGMLVIIALVALAIRVWFDAAQCEIVADNRRSVWRATGAAWRRLRGSFGGIWGRYVGINVLGLIAFAFFLLVWNRFVPPPRVGLAFIMGQLIALTWIIVRLWERAVVAVWYRSHAVAEPVRAPEPLVIDTSALNPATTPNAS